MAHKLASLPIARRGGRLHARKRTAAAALSGMAASGALLGAYLRQRGVRHAEPSTDEASTPRSPDTSDDRRHHDRWRCECAQEFRISGEGRHRVFWPADAPPEDAILDDRCPNCDRALSTQ